MKYDRWGDVDLVRVALPHLVVGRVVRGGDLHAAGAELRLRPLVDDEGDLALHERQPDFPTVPRHLEKRPETGQVRRMVVLQGARLVGVGVAVGLPAAFGLSGLLQGLLYRTEPLDPTTFGAMSVVMLVVGMIASYVPARRASSVDPLEAIRLE